MELSYFTIPILFVFIQYSIILASPVQIKVKRANICDNVECLPGHQCCKGGRDACGGNECEPCIDGTFSSGKVGEFCENCHNCLQGEDKIEECTREKDTVCKCPYGKYITSFSTCVPCDECNEKDCKIVCNTTTTPTPLKKSTTPARTTVMTTPSQTTSTSIPPTTDIQEEGSSWKYVYLVPIISSPVSVIFVIGGLWICAKRSLCCWTKKSREFWADYCPCCCKHCNDEADRNPTTMNHSNNVYNITGDNAILNFGDNLTINGTAPLPAGDNSSSRSQSDSVDSVYYSAEEELSVNDSCAAQDPQHRTASSVKRSGKSLHTRLFSQGPSNLPDVPEYVLPEWCFQDEARVEVEHISEISMHIGNQVARIGDILGLSNGEVDNIKHNNSDLSDQNFEVLKLWLLKKGVDATKGIFARALSRVGLAELAKDYLWSDQEWKQDNENEPLLSSGTLAVTKESARQDTSGSNLPDVHDPSSSKDDPPVPSTKWSEGDFDGKDWREESTWQEILDIMLTLVNIFRFKQDFTALKLFCSAIKLKQPALENVKSCQYFKEEHDLNITALSMLEDSQFRNLKPINVPSESDSLFYTASFLYNGSYNHVLEFKVRTIIEMVCHKDNYLKNGALIRYCKKFGCYSGIDRKSFFQRSVICLLSDKFPMALYYLLHSLPGNPFYLFGVASVLNCTLHYIYPDRYSSKLNAKNILITPHKKIENPATVFVMGYIYEETSYMPLLKAS